MVCGDPERLAHATTTYGLFVATGVKGSLDDLPPRLRPDPEPPLTRMPQRPPSLRNLQGYWRLSGGVTQDEARAAVKIEGFNFEIGRESRFENARNAVVISRKGLLDGLVNRIELAEEIQHAIDRATHEASRATRRGITNEQFHAEVFQRIILNYQNGRLSFLLPDDITNLRKLVQELSR